MPRTLTARRVRLLNWSPDAAICHCPAIYRAILIIERVISFAIQPRRPRMIRVAVAMLWPHDVGADADIAVVDFEARHFRGTYIKWAIHRASARATAAA